MTIGIRPVEIGQGVDGPRSRSYPAVCFTVIPADEIWSGWKLTYCVLPSGPNASFKVHRYMVLL